MLLFTLFAGVVSAQEICDNGVDDDGNGLVDLNDPMACPCDLVAPQPSLITNGSFEDNTCCPQGVSMNPNDYLSCATGWMDYMVSATAEYFACGFMPPALPQPVPDGSAAAGFGAFTDWSGSTSYYEILTNCLNAPMITGQLYELEFDVAATRSHMSPTINMGISYPVNFGPIDLTIYGFSTCPTAPYVFYDPVFGNPLPANYCPTELGWTELGHVTYDPVNAWQELSVTFTPTFDVAAIMFGPACPIPADYISTSQTWPYFFVDGFSLEPVELTVNFVGSPCTDDLVLTAEPFEPMNSYQWYLNGAAIVGETTTTLAASALGLEEGVYAIRAVSPNGACKLAEAEVEVAYPQPLLNATPTEGCAPLNVEFMNMTDPVMSGTLEWDLGDGTTTALTNPAHTYELPGSYDVRLTVTSPSGCARDSLFQDLILVHPTPQAAFQPSLTEACVGEPITFTDTSVPADTYTCAWSLGDGTLSDACPTIHAYSAAGTYNVLLSVSNAFGCADDTLMSQLVEIIPTPEPDFSFTTDSGCIPLEVRFENDTPGQEEQTAFWDLGNGQTATTHDAIALYTSPGVYSVALTMTNTLGCSATHTKTNAITAYGLPVVTFFVEPDSGCAPLDVQFTNTTDPGMIGGCFWAFGDGTTSPDCAAQHTYVTSGTYTVSLTVNSPAGCEGDTTLFHLVHVDPSPIAHFTFGPQPTDFYRPEITFIDNSSEDAIDWDWHFPAGTPEASANTTTVVRYPNDRAGTYPVRLTVTNEHGCTDTIILPVTIDGVHSVYAPNAFTPDGDAINGIFLPIIRDDVQRDHDMRIFDRWGQEVFRSSDPSIGWDGRVNGAEPKTDVYIWKLRSRNGVDGIMREYTGHVTVLR
ncbi:MAG: PKD domain-containing protein [Flavobacteriales bacterium]|nr:PKD domain-containing protein [Flavobacteriales bacterium]